MATAPVEQTANPVAVIRQNLAAMQPEFKAALPPHITPERFTRVAMTAIQNTPALANADRRSLFGAFVKLAQDGLLPDGREAAVVMFGNKAQAMPMIGGILKRIRQSGEVSRVSAHVVYSNDHFEINYGFDEDVKHVPPPLDQPRGDPIGAYATAVLKDGSKLLEVMSLEEIEQVRAVSRAAKNGPWVGWWGEMARKTVMRRLSKRLPMSTDIEEEIFSRDETLEIDAAAVRRINDNQKVEGPPPSRLDMIEHQIERAEPEETPEVEEQAEELEAEIEDEQPPQVNDESRPGENGSDGAKSDAEKAVDEIVAKTDAAKTPAALEKLIKENEAHKVFLSDDLQLRLELAYDRNRRRLEAKVEEPAK